MDSYIIIRYLHFLGILLVVGGLVAEFFLLKKELTRQEVKKLSVIDSIYGIGSIVVVGAGFLMWFSVGKPADFYSYNWIFYTKVFLFLLVGILSIWPTVFFFRNRKGPAATVIIPEYIIYLVRIELIIVALLPLLAVMMAMGIGTIS